MTTLPTRPARKGRPVRFAGAGGLPQPLADLRPPARAGGRAVRPLRPDAAAVQRPAAAARRPPGTGPHARPRRPPRLARAGHHPPARQAGAARPDRPRPPGRQPPRRPHRHHRRGAGAAGRSARAGPRLPRPPTRPPVAEGTRNDLIALLRAARLPHEDPDSSWRVNSFSRNAQLHGAELTSINRSQSCSARQTWSSSAAARPAARSPPCSPSTAARSSCSSASASRASTSASR